MKDANSASPTVSGAIALALAASMLSGSKNASLDAKIAWPPVEERVLRYSTVQCEQIPTA